MTGSTKRCIVAGLQAVTSRHNLRWQLHKQHFCKAVWVFTLRRLGSCSSAAPLLASACAAGFAASATGSASLALLPAGLVVPSGWIGGFVLPPEGLLGPAPASEGWLAAASGALSSLSRFSAATAMCGAACVAGHLEAGSDLSLVAGEGLYSGASARSSALLPAHAQVLTLAREV